ncbi:hypothetical protein [Entomospira culicis]|uniref:DUF2059 domain-containing protein n=1 Tax=Entomospira culicis TaxID=2719989 RepID=A0A968GGR9_9SPIO|nr:hypothetical protein [Entomospira culicis]NIZ19554.1 hypothetical protein [Entomospira culicis]NIZ69541.1 hypothetical protein [Entomospira culicis]WDI36653.1 hypothetical protein PVA46_04830 [Entomospira culicis]WDI38282.1 hypothetical protein PVA47_04840 [Entomospira culicis]
MKKMRVLAFGLIASLLFVSNSWANSVQFELVSSVGNAFKREQKAKVPSLAFEQLMEIYAKMGQPSDFDDYVAPVITKNQDALLAAYETVFAKSELNKIKKLNMFKENTMQRDWMIAMSTSGLPLIKKMMDNAMYEETYRYMASIWGSEQFMKQRNNEIIDFYIQGVAFGAGVTDEAELQILRDTMRTALNG